MSYFMTTLSSDNYITSANRILDRVLAAYILTSPSQTYLFQGHLTALSITWSNYLNDPDEFARQITSDLEKIVGRYFDNPKVNSYAKTTKDSRYVVFFSVTVITEKEGVVELAKVMVNEDSLFKEIATMMNSGEALSVYEGI